jgi:hypothetical protein
MNEQYNYPMKKIAGILTAALLPLLIQAQLVVNSNYLVMAGGSQSSPHYIVLNDSASSGITYNGGWIISENEFNMVQWNIRQSTGTFTVPFGYSTEQYLPLTMNIGSSPGVGSGNIKFSTYHTAVLNSGAEPSDVNNVIPFFLPGSPSNSDNSYNIVDRFYIIDANTGYTTKPAPDNITFSYIRGTGNSEVGSPNTITESRLMAQRYNSGVNSWNNWYGYGCTDAISSNVGTVQTGPLSSNDFYRSWSLWDNGMSLPISMSASGNPCSGGTATAAVLGGVAPYTYLWSDALSQTTANAGYLSAGTYTVTVHDSHGCSSTASINVTAPAILTISTTQTNIMCFGQNSGSATANPSGGIAPYTYSWSGGGTNALKSNLSAGSYTVTVSDNNGCNVTASVSITEPTQFQYVSTGVVSYPTCNGSTNGKATVNSVGGNLPYTYSWSNGSSSVSTTQSPSNLSAGNYTVTVTDNCGVSHTSSISITQPAGIHAAISSTTNVGCNGGNGGSATATATGGTFPYSFAWAPGGSTLATASGLSAGTYTVTVTDAHGCSATNAAPIATITQPTAIRDSVASITYPSCNGGKGSATIGVKGGTPPYSYTWTGGVSTTATANNISSRTYTVTIKDKHSCVSVLVFTLTQPLAIRDTIVSSEKVNVSCRGGNNGSATVGVKYGTAPFTYSWSNGQTNVTATGLSSGVYSVTVTDNNGCSGSVATVTITQPALALRDSISTTSCSNNLVKATVGVKGGTSPYTYAWSPGGGTKATMSGLTQGTYTITVTDAHGCTATFTKNLICGGIIKRDGQEDADSNIVTCCAGIDNINLYPNPNTGQFTVEIRNYELGITNVTAEVYNMLGEKVYAQSNIQHRIFNINISNQPNGVYLIHISSKDGQVVTQKKIVKTQ